MFKVCCNVPDCSLLWDVQNLMRGYTIKGGMIVRLDFQGSPGSQFQANIIPGQEDDLLKALRGLKLEAWKEEISSHTFYHNRYNGGTAKSATAEK